MFKFENNKILLNCPLTGQRGFEINKFWRFPPENLSLINQSVAKYLVWSTASYAEVIKYVLYGAKTYHNDLTTGLLD